MADSYPGASRMLTFCQDYNDSEILPSLAGLDAYNMGALASEYSSYDPVLSDALCLPRPFPHCGSQGSQSTLFVKIKTG